MRLLTSASSGAKKHWVSPTTPDPIRAQYPRSWWFSHGDAFSEEEADEHVKQAFANDRTALTIFAALLMTVNFAIFPTMNSATFRAENLYNYELQLFACSMFGLGTGTTLCTIIIGTFQYLAVNKWQKTVHATIDFCERSPGILAPWTQAIISVFATCAGSLAIMYLNQGWRAAMCAGCPMMLLVVVSVVYAMNSIFQSHTMAEATAASGEAIKERASSAADSRARLERGAGRHIHRARGGERSVHEARAVQQV